MAGNVWEWTSAHSTRRRPAVPHTTLVWTPPNQQRRNDFHAASSSADRICARRFCLRHRARCPTRSDRGHRYRPSPPAVRRARRTASMKLRPRPASPVRGCREAQMHQTTLPRGKQIATEPPPAGVAADGESAEAAGAARTSKGKAITVAATVFTVLVDIFHPSTKWLNRELFSTSP
ncbi:hypothetical protein ACQP2U_20120 [Nocardia sp. CA-084685]|uniref:hypothetical protein n=1 Tax=Nocardia sp. CA-084685 TaxID=3239970 RepID=UPI003D96E784